jgi:hypothetical protein
MQAQRRMFRLPSESCIEAHIKPVVSCAIEERAFRDVNAKHFLQAYRLGANLNLIATVPLWPAAFVLNRKRTPQSPDIDKLNAAFVRPMKFHNIGDSRQPKPQRPERKSARNPDIPARFGPVASLMHLAMQVLALNRKRIVRPHIFNMDQRTLPLAEYKVLKPGKLKQILFIIAWLRMDHFIRYNSFKYS